MITMLTILGLLSFINISGDEFDQSDKSNKNDEAALVDYVNPLMGTDSKYTLSNGNNYSRSFISYDDIQKGGELTFKLGNGPNKKWGIDSDSVPFSLSSSKVN